MSQSIIPVQSTPTFYQHTRRPAWGLSILAGETESGIKYQFEDGKLRTIAPGYADRLMERVDPPHDASQRYVDLATKLGVAQVHLRSGDGDAQRLTVDEQVSIFKESYADAFRDSEWCLKMRGIGAKRSVKRHRESSIVAAQRLLERERMRKLIDEEQTQTVWNGLIEVLSGTDLVPKAEVDGLRRVGALDRIDLCDRLQDLLHGVTPIGPRVDRFSAALIRAGLKPTWSLVTAPMALTAPQHHVYVRPAIMRRQVKSLAPRIKIDREPTGRVYAELHAMVCGLKRDLERRGLKPRDLIDVCDFIHRSTKPGARPSSSTKSSTTLH